VTFHLVRKDSTDALQRSRNDLFSRQPPLIVTLLNCDNRSTPSTDMISSVPSQTKKDIFTTVTVSGDSVLALLQRLEGPRQDPSSPHSPGALSILAHCCLLERSVCPPMFGKSGEQPVGRLDIYISAAAAAATPHQSRAYKHTHHSSVVTRHVAATPDMDNEEHQLITQE
jgi:hypothetical protein